MPLSSLEQGDLILVQLRVPGLTCVLVGAVPDAALAAVFMMSPNPHIQGPAASETILNIWVSMTMTTCRHRLAPNLRNQKKQAFLIASEARGVLLPLLDRVWSNGEVLFGLVAPDCTHFWMIFECRIVLHVPV